MLGVEFMRAVSQVEGKPSDVLLVADERLKFLEHIRGAPPILLH